jgi:hypothetical protein
MNSKLRFVGRSEHRWTSLDVFDRGDKFILEERGKYDAARNFVEMALCVIVSALFIGSFLLFVLPEIALLRSYPIVSVSAVMVGIAMLLYVFATRGFKPQVGFDRSKRQIWVCKLNSKGHARVVIHYPTAEVQSVFIRRPEAGRKDATLLARIHNKNLPVTLLRGTVSDIEAAHAELCDVLNGATTKKTSTPDLAAKFRKARENRLFGAKAT